MIPLTFTIIYGGFTQGLTHHSMAVPLHFSDTATATATARRSLNRSELWVPGRGTVRGWVGWSVSVDPCDL